MEDTSQQALIEQAEFGSKMWPHKWKSAIIDLEVNEVNKLLAEASEQAKEEQE